MAKDGVEEPETDRTQNRKG